MKMKNVQGQAAIEYMLLLAIVAIVVFVGFNKFVPQGQQAAEEYYNKTVIAIYGDPPPDPPEGPVTP